ncbi:cytochrome p450 [Holotrichia oblita]|uniref:Cytochrome p450 n=1 Tax=Holotrichia oblita TaxID=644536 RepID=A0ACB9SZR5_HOLOL|nr:cytochrome p450 [Holotrichia oblita]
MSFLNILFSIFGVLIATVILIIVLFRQRYKYWKNRGVEYLKPTIPVGNADDRTKPSGELFANYYHTMKKKNVPYAGMYFFHLPVFIPIDLDLIKRIIQTDFVHFMDHGIYYHEEVDPLSAHIFALNGQKWRNLRTKLTPTFTSGKMKNMFPIVVKISQELVNVITDECKTGPIETKDVAARFTTDIIGNCAFGIECNSLKDPNTEFRVHAKRLFALTQPEILLNLLTFIIPGFMRMCRVRFFPKEATDFFGT